MTGKTLGQVAYEGWVEKQSLRMKWNELATVHSEMAWQAAADAVKAAIAGWPRCERCRGTGGDVEYETCPACGGLGRVEP